MSNHPYYGERPIWPVPSLSTGEAASFPAEPAVQSIEMAVGDIETPPEFGVTAREKRLDRADIAIISAGVLALGVLAINIVAPMPKTASVISALSAPGAGVWFAFRRGRSGR